MPFRRKTTVLRVSMVAALAVAVVVPLALVIPLIPPSWFSGGSVAWTDVAAMARHQQGGQASHDRMVTTSGDASGLHVLVADAANGYAWRTAATLAEPGLDSDQYVGQDCVTGSGDRAVVVYAPRQFLNQDALFHSSALAAVVDLNTGQVTKLPETVSIAYHDPGCGLGEQAVLSRNDNGKTTLLTVDAARGNITARADVAGQLTSAVPYSGGVAAAKGNSLISVDTNGSTRTLATTSASPFRLGVDSDGGVAYQVQSDKSVEVHRFAAGQDSLVGTDAQGTLQVHAGAGRVFVTGSNAPKIQGLPTSWGALDAPIDADISTTGALAVTSATSDGEAAGRPAGTSASGALSITINARILGTGVTSSVQVLPQARSTIGTSVLSPALHLLIRDPSTTTWDPDRGCAVPRNDPHIQSLQPSAAMSEWAVDLAVQGKLTTPRQPGWNGAPLPAYQPQTLFPPHQLSGGGRVPAQIMLGVLSQESNLNHASKHAAQGDSGNFNQGGFYGRASDGSLIDWSTVDCGYGIAQVTDGMKRGDIKYTATQQTALTVDYAANIAAGLQILQDKWNTLRAAGVIANNGDPKYLENWWFALWAYNSGYHDKGSDPSGMSGLGWTNNPANPDFPPDRKMFLSTSRDDAATPNHWSYPERVLGWAAFSQLKTDPATGKSVNAFPPGNWSGNPQNAEPARFQFCTVADNQCDPAHPHQPSDNSEPAGACQRDDLKCWWHSPATWTNCASTCGTEVLTYRTTDPEPRVPTPYPAQCESGLPPSAVIVDDVSSDVGYAVGNSRPCAGRKNWTSQGALSFTFGSSTHDRQTVYPSKVDFHQLASGLGGHFWFGYNYPASRDDLKITGTWTPNLPRSGRYRIQAFLPDHDAAAKVAYVVYPGTDPSGVTHDPITVPVDQNINGSSQWKTITDAQLYPGAKVELTNLSSDPNADGSVPVAFDAVAFTPES